MFHTRGLLHFRKSLEGRRNIGIGLYPGMSSVGDGFEGLERGQDIRLVVDTIPELVWSTRPDGSDEFFIQRWLEYTGLSAEQALDCGWKVAIHPEDLPRMLETFHEALRSRRCFLKASSMLGLARSAQQGSVRHLQI